MPPRVSIIIPVVNSPSITRALDAIRAQRYDLCQCEVLVVGLDEAGRVQQDALVRHIDTGGRLSAAKNRNIGIREAAGEIICFTDSDCVPFPDWLHWLTVPFDHPNVYVVGGGIAVDANNYWTWCDNISWFYQFLACAPAGQRGHLPSLNLALRRNVVDTVGMFGEQYERAAGEDTEWTLRMRSRGFQLVFEPRALVQHAPDRSSLGQLWQHAYLYGRYSPKVGGGGAHTEMGLERRFLPKQRWAMALLTPLFSTLATARVMATHWKHPRIWKSIPGVWLSKVAWCLGASQALHAQ